MNKLIGKIAGLASLLVIPASAIDITAEQLSLNLDLNVQERRPAVLNPIPCLARRCPGEYEFFNFRICECDCRLSYMEKPCPDGSVLDKDCCICVIDPCEP